MSDPAGFDAVEARLRALLRARQPARIGDLDPRGLEPADGLTPAAVLLLLERVRAAPGPADDVRGYAVPGYNVPGYNISGYNISGYNVPSYNIIFTERTHHVEHHKGEVSLAGGTRDPDDADLLATAVREAHEELGIEPAGVTVLGTLDELVTVTRFLVTPVVGVIDAGYPLRPHAREVERVLHVPMAVLRDPAAWFEEERAWRGKTYRVRSCRYREHVIWGATSRIVQRFLDVVPPDVL